MSPQASIFKAQPFKALEDVVSKGHVHLLLTDITDREVRARIEKTVIAQLGPVEKFKKQARPQVGDLRVRAVEGLQGRRAWSGI